MTSIVQMSHYLVTNKIFLLDNFVSEPMVLRRLKKHGNFLKENTTSVVPERCLALQIVIKVNVAELQYHMPAMDKSGTISERKLPFYKPHYLNRAKPGSYYI